MKTNVNMNLVTYTDPSEIEAVMNEKKFATHPDQFERMVEHAIGVIPHEKKEGYEGPQSEVDVNITFTPQKHPVHCGAIIDQIGFFDKKTNQTMLAKAKEIIREYDPQMKIWSLKEVATAVSKKPGVNFHPTTKDGPYGPYQTFTSGQKQKLRNNQIPNANILPNIVVVILPSTSADTSLMENTDTADGTKRYFIKTLFGPQTRCESEHITINADPIGGSGDIDRISSTNRNAIVAWAENTGNNVHVLIDAGHVGRPRKGVELPPRIVHLTPADLFPTYNMESFTDTLDRHTADVWAYALGWEFESPLYERAMKFKDPTYFCKRHGLYKLHSDTWDALIKEYHYRVNELKTECYTKHLITPHQYRDAIKTLKKQMRERWNHYYDTTVDPDTSAPASSKDRFQLYHRVTPDSEVAEFKKWYDLLEAEGLKEDHLTEGYQICPHCGRPIRIDKADLDLKDLDNPEMLMLKVRASKTHNRFIKCSQTEFDNIKHLEAVELALKAGVIDVLSLADGLQAMCALTPMSNIECDCGFEIPASYARITNALSFNEAIDTDNESDSDESSEMLSSEDETVCNDLSETVADMSAESSADAKACELIASKASNADDFFKTLADQQTEFNYDIDCEAIVNKKFDRAIAQCDFDDARKAFDWVFNKGSFQLYRIGAKSHIDITTLMRRAYKGEAYAEPVEPVKYCYIKRDNDILHFGHYTPNRCPAMHIDEHKIIASLTNNCLGRCPAFEALEK